MVQSAVQRLCARKELDGIEWPTTTYKSIQQLFCEEQLKKRKKKCFLDSEKLVKLPFEPLCLLQVKEGLCRKGERQEQIETMMKLQREAAARKYVRDDVAAKERKAHWNAMLARHSSNKEKENKRKPWDDVFVEQKRCAPRKSDAVKPYKLLQEAYKNLPVPPPPDKPTPSSLKKSIHYCTKHEAIHKLDFRLRALYKAEEHFNAPESLVCSQHLTALLHKPILKQNKCGCSSCDCNYRTDELFKPKDICVCPKDPCYPLKAEVCLCGRQVFMCTEREDGSKVKVSQYFKREHPSSIKKINEGPHTRMSNDGYARIKEDGQRFNS